MFGVVPWFLWKWRSKGVFGGDASLHSTPLNSIKNPAARIHFSNESALNLLVKKQAALTGWNPTPQGAAGTGGRLRDNYIYGTHLSFLNLEKNLFYGIMYLFQSRKTYVMFV